MAYIVRIYELTPNGHFNKIEESSYHCLNEKIYFPIAEILKGYIDNEDDGNATIFLRVSPEPLIDSVLYRVKNAIIEYFSESVCNMLDIKSKDISDKEISTINESTNSSSVLHIVYGLETSTFETMMYTLLGNGDATEQVKLIMNQEPSLLKKNVDDFFRYAPFNEKNYRKKAALIVSAADFEEIREIFPKVPFPLLRFVEIIYMDTFHEKKIDVIKNDNNDFIKEPIDIQNNISPEAS